MKKRLAILLTAALILTGCGSGAASTETPANDGNAQETQQESGAEQESEAEASAAADTGAAPQAEGTSDKLIIYFSRTGEQYNVGVIEKGNTAIVAEMIAEQTGADLFEVIPADDHYPMTYDELTEVAKKEQNDNARPVYSGQLPDLSGYSTIFIGAPVWWGDWPMIMYTVFENNDFSGKTLIPFSTHEGSGLSGFDSKLAEACPGATVAEGLAIQGNDAQNNQEEAKNLVSNWLSNLGF